MHVTVKYALIMLCTFGLACGDDDGGNESQTQSDGMNDNMDASASNGDGCITDADCSAEQFCQATDPTTSPEGNCTPLGGDGASCAFGTQCADGLACAKDRSTGTGQCLSFPADCPETPTCECAIGLCDSMAGSSCSVGSTEEPESSITVTCAGGVGPE